MRMYRLKRRPHHAYMLAFSLLTGLLMGLQAWLAPVALAATPTATAQGLPPEDITRAEVAVVRLLVTYQGVNIDGDTTDNSYQCTGLGVLINSRPVDGRTYGLKEFENVVLTDGNLLNDENNKATCATNSPSAKLQKIDVFTSKRYNDRQPISFKVAITPSETTVNCLFLKKENRCEQNPATFTFRSAASQPFLEMLKDDKAGEIANQNEVDGQAIILKRQPSMKVSNIVQAQSQDYFALAQRSVEAEKQPLVGGTVEAGAPIVDATGMLIGLYVAPGIIVSAQDLQTFAPSLLSVANSPVNENWKKGMDAYYSQQFEAASIAFTQALAANPTFQAADHYAKLAVIASNPVRPPAQPAPTATPTPKGDGFTNNGVSFAGVEIPWWQLGILGAIVLALLLLGLILLLMRSQVKRRRQLKEDLADAERRATVEAQRIAEMEAAQHSAPANSANLQPMASQSYGAQSGSLVPKQVLHCPRCNMAMDADATYCGNCRLPLSPSESGLHLKIQPTQLQQAQQQKPVTATPAPPTQENRAFAEQPTLIPSRAMLEQPTLVQSGSLADQPTIDITQAMGLGAGNQVDLEKTVPFAMKQLNGQHLSFVVGTRSDPGIKRKYKPNEDSLFAAQGTLSGATDADRFGLFVVADGMGGHANGEDASRLAIQVIIDYILPKLSQGGITEQSGYGRLLEKGIQEANLAVHNNNSEQHGDMGTTVTAALVVGSVAYVANVGDSRTYLYRPANGLQKVTTDHSVVASLVEAGIIKPDDIYTHPKRNQIYRSLGEKSVVEVDVFTVPLQLGDKMLLCSDGLWDMVRDPKIETVIKHDDPNPSKTGEALVQAALEGGGEDNVSVIVVRIVEPTKSAKLPRVQVLAKPDTVREPKLQ